MFLLVFDTVKLKHRYIQIIKTSEYDLSVHLKKSNCLISIVHTLEYYPSFTWCIEHGNTGKSEEKHLKNAKTLLKKISLKVKFLLPEISLTSKRFLLTSKGIPYLDEKVLTLQGTKIISKN